MKNSPSSPKPKPSPNRQQQELIQTLQQALEALQQETPPQHRSQGPVPQKDKLRRQPRLIALLLPPSLRDNPRAPQVLATFRNLAHDANVDEFVTCGKESLLAGWKESIDAELRNPDSEMDKRELAVAYTVIESLISTIYDLGNIRQEKDEPEQERI